jgi:hypothetical protein
MGLFKNEAIAKTSPFRSGPLKGLPEVEEIVFDWVSWYNNDRLHSFLGNIPPEEYERAYYARTIGRDCPDQDASSSGTNQLLGGVCMRFIRGLIARRRGRVCDDFGVEVGNRLGGLTTRSHWRDTRCALLPIPPPGPYPVKSDLGRAFAKARNTARSWFPSGHRRFC